MKMHINKMPAKLTPMNSLEDLTRCLTFLQNHRGQFKAGDDYVKEVTKTMIDVLACIRCHASLVAYSETELEDKS